LRELGLGVSVIVERADSADVIATEGEHQIIGDAKAFRLSRTAKNQKDFKVEALNQWRRGAHYATLVAPLYQYPSDNSQIYSQASRYNVTLLSSTHLAFLIRHKPAAGISLQPLWELGTGMTASSSAAAYWNAVTKAILQITGVPKEAWEAAVRDTYARLPRQADQEIRHWEEEKARIAKLNHDQAVMELIEALKIDSKIATIRRNSVRGGA
jgi:type II restriction enzyme